MTSQLPEPTPPSHYRSYLVRFWQSNDAGCWRASAQCVQSDSTVLFGDVASLLAFLQSEIGEPCMTTQNFICQSMPKEQKP